MKEVEEEDYCELWSVAFNVFSAGTAYGAEHPNATTEELIDACARYATNIFPHKTCCDGTPFPESPDHPLSVESFWREQAKWSDATFGTEAERGPGGPLKHLQKEVVETIAAIGTEHFGEEVADCLFLVFDAARRGGLTLQTMMRKAWQKLAINKSRKWQARSSDEPVEHVRE